MKKIFLVLLLISTAFLVIYISYLYFSKPILNYHNYTKVSFEGIDTDDYKYVKSIVKSLNSVLCYKTSEYKPHLTHDNIKIVLFKANEECNEIVISGEYIEYNGVQYEILPFDVRLHLSIMRIIESWYEGKTTENHGDGRKPRGRFENHGKPRGRFCGLNDT